MKTHINKTAELGDLVALIFDNAAQYSTDPQQISHLATQAVSHLLRRGRKPPCSESYVGTNQEPGPYRKTHSCHDF
jgi:hypothetical protein